MAPSPLKLERLRRGWSQHRVALALGVGQQVVSRCERGERLNGPTFLALCRLYSGLPRAMLGRMLRWRDQVASRQPVSPLPVRPAASDQARALA